MGLLPESAVRFFTRIFGTAPPVEDVGTTSAGNADDAAANHTAAKNRSEGFPAHPPDRAGRPAWAWWTVLTVLTLTSGGLLSMVVMIAVLDPPRGVNLPPLPPALRPAVVRNPCTVNPMTDAELALLAIRRWPELQERLHREPFPRTEQAIQDDVDAAFEPIYARIPTFLDWHYSLAGQYTQFAQVILDWLESEIAPAVRDRLRKSQIARAFLDRLLESDLARAAIDWLPDSEGFRKALDRLQERVDSGLFDGLPDRVRHATAHVEKVMREEMRALVEEQIQAEARTLPALCTPETGMPCADGGTVGIGNGTGHREVYECMLTAAIPQTVRRFTVSAAPTGIIAVGAAFRGAAAARALINGLKRRLLFRFAGPAAGAIGGGLVGSAVWLAVDVVVLFTDEYFNRDELRAELTALVDERKATLRASISEAVAEEKSTALGEFRPFELDGRR